MVALAADRDLTGAVLPLPVGRLPGRVRGRDDLAGLAAAPDGRVQVLAAVWGLREVDGRWRWRGGRRRRAAGCGGFRRRRRGLLLGLAQQLGAADGEVQDALAGRVRPSDVLRQQLETARGWVLVLDNADDPGALADRDRAAGDGAGWLLPSLAGLVVVTSRTSDLAAWGPAGGGAPGRVAG